MIQRKKKRTARIGIFVVGHATYWEQFPGLLENLLGYHKYFCEMVESCDVEISDFGMIDSSEKAFAAADQILGAGVDVLFCNMVTYATSSVFGPIIRAVNLPVVLIALQPRSALDYSRANTFMQLENDNICSVPEFTGVAIRMGKKVEDVIIGTLYDDADARQEITRWCDIAKVLHDLKGARMGLLGHVLEAMYDMHADPTAISASFGVHVPLLEIEDVVRLYDTVTQEEIEEKEAIILREFDTPVPVSDPVTQKLTDADLHQAAHTAVALDKLVEKYNLTGLAYYYEGSPDSVQRRVASSFIVGNSILNAQGIPMCGEFDIKTCIAMLIMDRLDIGGSFAEFHPFDFAEDFILVGHDGPHHIKIAEESLFYEVLPSTMANLGKAHLWNSRSRKVLLPCWASPKMLPAVSSLLSVKGIPRPALFRPPATQTPVASSSHLQRRLSKNGSWKVRHIITRWVLVIMPKRFKKSDRSWELSL